MTLAGLWRQGLNRLAMRHARIVETVPLGFGARLLVVEFGQQRLLIGQTRQGLTRMAASRLP